METFADRLIKGIAEKESVLCVGIDPRLEILPAPIIQTAQDEFGRTLDAALSALRAYCFQLIDVISPLVAVVKPQAGFFERFGPRGMLIFSEVSNYAAAKGLIVIGDVKRGDIGSTAAAYADGYLGYTELFGLRQSLWYFDAITVSPYFGSDGVGPFIETALDNNKGVFILLKTSNPSSVELQDLTVDGRELFYHLADLIKGWSKGAVGERGFYSVGVVVGATYPQEMKELRKLLPQNLFLVPGFGIQGAGIADIVPAFCKGVGGAIVAVSRSIDFAYLREPYKSAYGDENWQEAVKAAVISINEKINSALKDDKLY